MEKKVPFLLVHDINLHCFNLFLPLYPLSSVSAENNAKDTSANRKDTLVKEARQLEELSSLNSQAGRGHPLPSMQMAMCMQRKGRTR